MKAEGLMEREVEAQAGGVMEVVLGWEAMVAVAGMPMEQ